MNKTLKGIKTLIDKFAKRYFNMNNKVETKLLDEPVIKPNFAQLKVSIIVHPRRWKKVKRARKAARKARKITRRNRKH